MAELRDQLQKTLGGTYAFDRELGGGGMSRVFVAEGLPYYTMPLVEGDSLRTRLIRHGELPIPDAVKILRDMASALSCAYKHGLVHRDIKPENVMLTKHQALIMDFGTTRAPIRCRRFSGAWTVLTCAEITPWDGLALRPRRGRSGRLSSFCSTPSPRASRIRTISIRSGSSPSSATLSRSRRR